MYMQKNSDLHQSIIQRFNYRCVQCFRRYNHIHHIVPRSLGGQDVDENLIPLCNRCHDDVHRRGAKNFMAYFQKLRKRRLKELGFTILL